MAAAVFGAVRPRVRGRPSLFTDALADLILERLAAGASLRAICRSPDLPAESTIRGWATTDRDGFAARYAHARRIVKRP